jgi:hypothetical protein
MSTSRPRSLADDLRQRTDDDLAALVRRRPDLATPPPGDFGQLAGRSATHASTGRALDHLTRFQLQVLEAAVLCDEPFTPDQVVALLPDVDRSPVDDALSDLRLLALLWGGSDALGATVSVREALGRFPAGLGPPLAQLGGGDAVELAAVLDEAPADAQEVVDALTWSSPTGRVRNADRQVTPDNASTPVEWLLARGVLRPLDPSTVVLPRELSLHRRQGRLHRDVAPDAPTLDLHHHDPKVVDRLATGTADELVRRVQALLDRWALEAPAVLKSGGLGVRDLRAAASALDVDESLAALIVEVSAAAGLLATSGEVADEWLPTPAYDVWRTRDVADRWEHVAQAWLTSTRVAGLVGPVDGGERVNALTPEADRLVAPDIRPVPPRASSRRCDVTSGDDRAVADGCATTSSAGRCTRRTRWAFVRAGQSALSDGCCSQEKTPPTRSTRCCPTPSTTCCCRQTSLQWRRAH